MRPYTENDYYRLENSRAPLNHSIDESWPTPAQVDYHLRNAEIMRAAAVGDAARSTIDFIRSIVRKMRGLSTKLRAPIGKPGATA